jgi:TIR domain
MHGTIFISYRRAESLVEARALYERLARDFPGRVFIDLEGIDFGDDFVESLQRQMVGCQVMLVLIGPGWLGQAQDGGSLRPIDDDNDFVRIELRVALQRGIRVVPVLLNGATLPKVTDLPVELRSLVRRQAMTFDFHRFDRDAGALSGMLRRMVKAQVANAEDRVGLRHRLVGWGAAALALAVLSWLVLDRSVHDEAPSGPVASAPPARSKAASAAAPASAAVATPASGARLRDCTQDICPWLRVIPTGSFTMGSPPTETGRVDNEGPMRAVSSPPSSPPPSMNTRRAATTGWARTRSTHNATGATLVSSRPTTTPWCASVGTMHRPTQSGSVG